MKCINCSKELKIRSQVKYCSNQCQIDHQYTLYIALWKKQKIIDTKNISKYIKRYFIEKYSESCMLCGWNERNRVTKKVPLEIDHIDGDSQNNLEINLRIICPNCHALTSNFKNLNRGKGRLWRKNKYLKNK